jgi:leucyl/phenylalanyl-tRNA--protein transferase
MSTIVWLDPLQPPDRLPEPATALTEPNGLLAAGGSLSPQWLLTAYTRGIFPWYEAGQPILWWSPDPRFVLLPQDLHQSRSLRRTLRRTSFEYSADCAFAEVVDACAEPRRYTRATWITAEMAAAYKELRRLGWAHSFETWQAGKLAGGLYGVSMGRVFFGESMFTRISDASKAAFVQAARFLPSLGIELIDCQMPTNHLGRFGARIMARDAFIAKLGELVDRTPPERSWADSFAHWRTSGR